MITKAEIESKKAQFNAELAQMYKSYLLSGDAEFTDIRYEGIKSGNVSDTNYNFYSEEWRCKVDGHELWFYTLTGLVEEGADYTLGEYWYAHGYDIEINKVLELMSDEEIATICKHIINKSNVQPQNMD